MNTQFPWRFAGCAALTFVCGSLALAAASATASATPPSVCKKEQKEVTQALAARLRSTYIFPQVAARAADRILKKTAAGDYGACPSAENFAAALQADLRAIAGDKHLEVGVTAGPAAATDDRAAARRKAFEQKVRAHNYGFEKLEILPGNLGYLRVTGFPPPELAEKTLRAAMQAIAATDALILDLRDNTGGSPAGVVMLASYFFSSSFVINTIEWRDKPTQIFRTEALGAAAYGEQKPLFVLISPRTFSGGEELAYDLQSFKRGLLIGERTGGGANPGDRYDLPRNFLASIPSGRAVNPVTGTNWEGVGVKPDLEIPADRALEKAVELARQAMAPKTEPAARAGEATSRQSGALP